MYPFRGTTTTRVAWLQVAGVDINPTSYSKLEGQLRLVTDKELYAIAKVLNVEIARLFEPPEEE